MNATESQQKQQWKSRDCTQISIILCMLYVHEIKESGERKEGDGEGQNRVKKYPRQLSVSNVKAEQTNCR